MSFTSRDYLKLFEAGEESLRRDGIDPEDAAIRMMLIGNITQIDGVSREEVADLGLIYLIGGIEEVRKLVNQSYGFPK